MLVSRLTGGNSDNDSFFRGNRRSPWYMVSFGMIGASLSGVTFVSVPGMVQDLDMTYIQTCIGFFLGYIFIAKVLLPLYYDLQVTSIYSYLYDRFGVCSYKTGAVFFLFYKTISASIKLYIFCIIIHKTVLSSIGISFYVTVSVIVLIIWLYTHNNGIKTIVWTDSIQTLFLLLSLLLIMRAICNELNIGADDAIKIIADSEYNRIFVFSDWDSRQNFFKQLLSGIFIVIVMTGLDQDMMQKNLSCKNLHEAKKNMYYYGFLFLPVNFIFLSLGILLLTFSAENCLVLPSSGDDILPFFVIEGYFGFMAVIFFSIGITAAAFSSADSAMTSITTCFCIDILDIDKTSKYKAEKQRKFIHFIIAIVFICFIIIIDKINYYNILDTLYTIVSYVCGPLLGLFVFGMSTKIRPCDRYIPFVTFTAPIICISIDNVIYDNIGYKFGYEMLVVNGLITFIGLLFLKREKEISKLKQRNDRN